MSNLTDFLFPKATQAQAEAGTSNSVLMTPQSTVEAIRANAPVVELETITISGTFAKHPDDIGYFLELIGAGGGGGYNSGTTNATLGGFGGQYLAFFIDADEVGGSVPVVIGSGGPGASSSGSGEDGGSTSFGPYTAAGGTGGVHNIQSANIDDAKNVLAAYGQQHRPNSLLGLAQWGGGLPPSAGGAVSGTSARAAANSERCGRGGDGNTSAGQAGGDGQAPGGGGGASNNGGRGGNGARGEVRVYRFKRIS